MTAVMNDPTAPRTVATQAAHCGELHRTAAHGLEEWEKAGRERSTQAVFDVAHGTGKRLRLLLHQAAKARLGEGLKRSGEGRRQQLAGSRHRLELGHRLAGLLGHDREHLAGVDARLLELQQLVALHPALRLHLPKGEADPIQSRSKARRRRAGHVPDVRQQWDHLFRREAEGEHPLRRADQLRELEWRGERETL
jgi:hypothetical protein